jgi:hypothetical protein
VLLLEVPMSTPSREQVEAFLQSVSVAADAAGLRLMCAELDNDVLCALSGDIVPKCGGAVHGPRFGGAAAATHQAERRCIAAGGGAVKPPRQPQASRPTAGRDLHPSSRRDARLRPDWNNAAVLELV